MPTSNATLAQSAPIAKEDLTARVEFDQSTFSLRDTLSGITVCDANFSEFLAVLKNCGMQAVKPN